MINSRNIFIYAILWICIHRTNYTGAFGDSKYDLIITGYHFGHNTSDKIGQRWLIPPNIKQDVTIDAECGILYTGTLRVDKKETKQWLHGYGSLTIGLNSMRKKLACIYMTNVGVFPNNPIVRTFYFSEFYLLAISYSMFYRTNLSLSTLRCSAKSSSARNMRATCVVTH